MLKKNAVSGWLMWFGAVAVMVTGLAMSPLGNNISARETSAYSELRTFTEVLSLVEQNYVNKIDNQKLMRGAIQGMLRTLDPHTSYLSPEFFKEIQVETTGRFGGLGIEITIRNNVLTVVTPIEGTPAYRAGVKAGDQIILVEKESTKDMTLQDAVKRLRGEPGSKVTITVRRKKVNRPLRFTITREVIRIKSVRSRMLPGGIAYIRVRSFQGSTGAEVRKTLLRMKEKNARALVLDLRNNPGGLLSQAVSVTDIFMGPGKLIVYTKGRINNQRHRYTSTQKAEGESIPVAILVNAGSASASEIVAGALQDFARAKVIGVKTFGKGSVQTIIPLSDGSGLRLTTALYYTPKGRLIQGVGIKPDIKVEARAERTDNARFIRESDLPRHIKSEAEKRKGKKGTGIPHIRARAPRIPAGKQKDVQLDRAVEYLKKNFLNGKKKRVGA